MSRIISISRRTDIPAFYTPWLMGRLRAGYCHTFNPYGGQVYRVSLKPQEVIALAFWTRNAAPLLAHLDELDQRGYRYYFGCSILGYPDSIETHNPALQTSIRIFQKLSDWISPRRVRWRYDPIILSSHTPFGYHLKQFEQIARSLEGYTDTCIFSFLEFYDKTTRNLTRVANENDMKFYKLSLEQQREIVKQLVGIGGTYGMTLYSCCNDSLIIEGVKKNRCIDPELISELVPSLEQLPPLRPSRKDCGCIASTDIGAYDLCLFGCTYCYATNHRSIAQHRHLGHDPSDSILWRPEHLRGVDLDTLAFPLKE